MRDVKTLVKELQAMERQGRGDCPVKILDTLGNSCDIGLTTVSNILGNERDTTIILVVEV